jgi:hypothetical protein
MNKSIVKLGIVALLLLVIILLSSCVSNNKKVSEEPVMNVTSETDRRFSSYYLGCIEGFITTYDLKGYCRPQGMDGQAFFKTLKETCTFKATIYSLSVDEK